MGDTAITIIFAVLVIVYVLIGRDRIGETALVCIIFGFLMFAMFIFGYRLGNKNGYHSGYFDAYDHIAKEIKNRETNKGGGDENKNEN